MALTVYCPNEKCCKANIYTLNKPKFCGFCGGSLESLGVASKPIFRVSTSRQNDNIESDDSLDSIDVSHLEDFKFDFTIDHMEDRRGVKLGELAKSQKTGYSRTTKKLTKKAQKKLVEDIQNEAMGQAKPIEIADNGPE